MFGGFPFVVPTAGNDAPQRLQSALRPRDSYEDTPQFSLKGWRRVAAIAFASAPAIVFLLNVIVHALNQP